MKTDDIDDVLRSRRTHMRPQQNQLWMDDHGNLWKIIRRKRGLAKGWFVILWSSDSDDESLFPDEDFGTSLVFVSDKP